MVLRDLQIYLAPKNKCIRKPLGVKKHVAITLYCHRQIGSLFGVGKSTVCESVHKVCTAINDNLLQRYVSFPSGEDLKTVIRGDGIFKVLEGAGGNGKLFPNWDKMAQNSAKGAK